MVRRVTGVGDCSIWSALSRSAIPVIVAPAMDSENGFGASALADHRDACDDDGCTEEHRDGDGLVEDGGS